MELPLMNQRHYPLRFEPLAGTCIAGIQGTPISAPEHRRSDSIVNFGDSLLVWINDLAKRKHIYAI